MLTAFKSFNTNPMHSIFSLVTFMFHFLYIYISFVSTVTFFLNQDTYVCSPTLNVYRLYKTFCFSIAHNDTPIIYCSLNISIKCISFI